MKIDIQNHLIITLKPYQLVSKAIDYMLAANSIHQSKSPWCFPIAVVTKMVVIICSIQIFDDSMLFQRTSWPLPVIELAVLGKARYFTTLDLKSGYWQIQLREEDKEKTVFGCHRGLYEYNILPLWLMNGPSTFQQLMLVVLHESGDCYGLFRWYHHI